MYSLRDGTNVMWTVGYIPGKLGSYERFMQIAAAILAGRGFNMTFVFRGEPLKEFREALERAGAKVYAIPMRSRLDITFVRRLWQLVKQNRVDILHSNFDLANFNSSVVALLAKVPVYIWHQHNFMGQHFSIARWLFIRTLGEFVDQVLCVSDSMRNHLVEKGFPVQQVRRIYIGPDLSAYALGREAKEGRRSLRQEMGWPEDAVVLVYVGGALPEKGHRYLVEAFSRLTAEFPSLRVLLVGAKHGSGSEKLAAQIRNLGLGAKVQLTHIRSDVPRILLASDISVIPPTEEV